MKLTTKVDKTYFSQNTRWPEN